MKAGDGDAAMLDLGQKDGQRIIGLKNQRAGTRMGHGVEQRDEVPSPRLKIIDCPADRVERDAGATSVLAMRGKGHTHCPGVQHDPREPGNDRWFEMGRESLTHGQPCRTRI